MFYKRLENMCHQFGDKIAFGSKNGEEKSYLTFLHDIKKAMTVMSHCREQRIGIMGAPSYEYIVLMYGAVSVGKDVVLLDPFLPRESQVALIDYSEVEILLHDHPEAELKDLLTDSKTCYRDFFTLDEKFEPINPIDGTMMFFTSGTTNLAKGTVIIPERLWNNLEPSIPLWNEGFEIPDDHQMKLYMPLTFNHIYGTCMTLLYLIMGYTIYFGNPRRMIVDLQEIEPDEMISVSTLIQMALKFGKPDSLRRVMSSGGPCSVEVQMASKAAGLEIRNIYGASEIGGIAINKTGKPVNHLVPLLGNEIKITDDETIWIKSSNFLREYYNKPEATKEFLVGEWVTLNDIGGMNDDGSFYVEGRRNNIIAMDNGDKLYLEEIEERLRKIDGVEEAGVLYHNQKIIAVLVMNDDATEDTLKNGIEQYNKDQTFQFKISEIWIRREPLPHANMGKIQRSGLKKQYLERMTNNE